MIQQTWNCTIYMHRKEGGKETGGMRNFFFAFVQKQQAMKEEKSSQIMHSTIIKVN